MMSNNNLEFFFKITKGLQFVKKEINWGKLGFLNVYLSLRNTKFRVTHVQKIMKITKISK